MQLSLSEEERKELDETLGDPEKSKAWANNAIDSWIEKRRVMREISKRSAKSSKISKKGLAHRIPQAAKHSQETHLDELEAYLLIGSLIEKLRLDK